MHEGRAEPGSLKPRFARSRRGRELSGTLAKKAALPYTGPGDAGKPRGLKELIIKGE